MANRRFATLLFTDIVSSTLIARELGGERWRAVRLAVPGDVVEVDPDTLQVVRTIEIADASIVERAIDEERPALWLDMARHDDA